MITMLIHRLSTYPRLCGSPPARGHGLQQLTARVVLLPLSSAAAHTVREHRLGCTQPNGWYLASWHSI